MDAAPTIAAPEVALSPEIEGTVPGSLRAIATDETASVMAALQIAVLKRNTIRAP
jgi:hypothetical protein